VEDAGTAPSTTGPRPTLSIVLVIVSDTVDPHANLEHLAGAIDAIDAQVDASPIEIVVPYHSGVVGMESFAARFPAVRFVRVDDPEARPVAGGGREHHDVLRSRGIAMARGDYIGMLEDHARADPRWCASALARHREGHAAVGGAIGNGIDRALNWAVYFCDFGRYQNPVPAGDSAFASDSNVVYTRAALDSVRDAWHPSFREVVVNAGLLKNPHAIVLEPGMRVDQHRSDLSLGKALRERYIWGRSYAETRRILLGKPQLLMLALLWPALPPVMLLRIARTAWQRRIHFGAFLRALPMIVLLLVTWSLGEGIGYLKGLAGGSTGGSAGGKA
jgi:hypothetical protein